MTSEATMIDLVEILRSIGLRASREALLALLKQAAKGKLSHAKLLEQLVALEIRERDARNLQRRSRTATLGDFKPIDEFDWNHPRKIDRDLYDLLFTLGFVEQGQNVLLRGPAGVGKTTLAQNLGLQALNQGLTVRLATVPEALADLMRQESLPATERRLKRYTQPDLLILDELGYVPCDSRAADLLFHIVGRRHEKRSVVVTTNLAFKQWTTVFPDASCLGALIDRFAQHCHVVDIDAESWREKHSIRRKPPSPRKPRPPRKPKRK
jgi:DNA replication protein DnaC